VRYRFGRVRGGMRGDDLVDVAFTPYVKIEFDHGWVVM